MEGKTKEELTEKDKQIEELQEGLKKATGDIEILKSVVDKKALSLFYERNKENLPTVVGIRLIGGKVIIGWKTKKDEGSYQDPTTKKWIEKQITSILYEDGTAEEMPLMDFYRQYNITPCDRIGITTDEITGEVAFKLKRQDNGKEYTIGVQFVN